MKLLSEMSEAEQSLALAVAAREGVEQRMTECLERIRDLNLVSSRRVLRALHATWIDADEKCRALALKVVPDVEVVQLHVETFRGRAVAV